jgi:tRNA-specific 2-thiouridylase
MNRRSPNAPRFGDMCTQRPESTSWEERVTMSKAIGIFSGGLDSMLSVETLRRQGIEVLAVTFETPFFSSKRAVDSARRLGVPHRVVDITAEHLEIVKNPRFGRGRYMNPCMDCHALMFKKAGEIMEAEGFDFLFSGEVLGQRPFSQNRQALEQVAKASGYPDRILRPLSAQLLPPSGPELRGLVDRSRLLAFKGRSRKPQMELARTWGIDHYPSPAGGCLLTDPGFSRRLKDLFENEACWDVRDLHLLSVGRHLRIQASKKVVVGRNREENEKIGALAREDDILLSVARYPGPLVMIPHGGPEELVEIASSICLRYSDAPKEKPHQVRIRSGGREWLVESTPCDPSLTDKWIVG